MLLDIDNEETDLDQFAGLVDNLENDNLLSFADEFTNPESTEPKSSFQQDLIDIFEAQQQPHSDQDPC